MSAGIAVRWPQLVNLLKTVDALGDVTTYLGAAAKVAKLPAKATRFVAGKFGRAERATEHLAGDAQRTVGGVEREASHVPHGEQPREAAHPSPGHHETVTVMDWHRSRRPIPGPRTPMGSFAPLPMPSGLPLNTASRFPRISSFSLCKGNGDRPLAMPNIWGETFFQGNG